MDSTSTRRALTLTYLTKLTLISGGGSEAVWALGIDKLTVTHINLQATAQRNHQTTFLRNNPINRRIQTKATTHTGTDEAAGAGKLLSFLFHNFIDLDILSNLEKFSVFSIFSVTNNEYMNSISPKVFIQNKCFIILY